MVFGLNVEENDNNFSAISKLLMDIDVNPHLIHSIYYLKTKNGQTLIKLVTYDVYSRNLILKAAKKFKKINHDNNSKITICQD